MDASTVFVLALAIGSVAALAAVERHSRRKQRQEQRVDGNKEPEAITPEKSTRAGKKR